VPRALAAGVRVYADCRVDRITRRDTVATGVPAHVGTAGRWAT
jgi:hypothetical protein